MTEKPRVILREINVEKLSVQEAEGLVMDVQGLPTVVEMHQIGLALEDLVKEKPMESKFHFDEAPPWALDRCVEEAVAWLNAHRAEYPGAPGAAPEAATPEKAPAAAEEKPAAAEKAAPAETAQ